MAEYINKQDALGVFHDWSNKEGELVSAKETSEYKAIENIPAADVVERKKGKWEYKPSLYPYGVEHFECSLCGESVVDRTNFCPSCGADCREEE